LNNPSEKPTQQNDLENHQGYERQRLCGTFVLRRSIEVMTEEQRQSLFDEWQALGFDPVV